MTDGFVRLTYDATRTVHPGDVLATRHGTRYLCVRSRDVQRRDPRAGRRQALTCERLPPGHDLDTDTVVHLVIWHSRSRRGRTLPV
jgi:hypothetical protein